MANKPPVAPAPNPDNSGDAPPHPQSDVREVIWEDIEFRSADTQEAERRLMAMLGRADMTLERITGAPPRSFDVPQAPAEEAAAADLPIGVLHTGAWAYPETERVRWNLQEVIAALTGETTTIPYGEDGNNIAIIPPEREGECTFIRIGAIENAMLEQLEHTEGARERFAKVLAKSLEFLARPDSGRKLRAMTPEITPLAFRYATSQFLKDPALTAKPHSPDDLQVSAEISLEGRLWLDLLPPHHREDVIANLEVTDEAKIFLSAVGEKHIDQFLQQGADNSPAR